MSSAPLFHLINGVLVSLLLCMHIGLVIPCVASSTNTWVNLPTVGSQPTRMYQLRYRYRITSTWLACVRKLTHHDLLRTDNPVPGHMHWRKGLRL